ncbi:amidohydrolase [Oceanibium sediminis]|uniref:amidohydrolase n=1 Tax=Oceanibium sediminis TaxID=2026339 RepID=UPI000DD43B53|nr:amidohydrolase [Oceanibium sediminis]
MQTPNLSDLVSWRRALHRQPEISGEEARTAETVCARLQPLKPDALVTGLGGHGVLAQFRGAAPAVRVLVRCELDGLPIAETNSFAHRSEIQGKGHLCGHDGHMAIVMGVAERLAARRIDHADVLLLFQPAEETGAGAKAVLEDPKFAPFTPDIAVALHNIPGLPLGQVQVRPGPVSCASAGLKITLIGKTAHASQPETGLSPAGAMMRIMTGLQELNSPPPATGVPARMATLTHAALGEPTFGVAPGRAEVFVTLRAVRDADMTNLCAQAEGLTRQIAAAAGLRAELSWHDVFHATTNDTDLAALIADAVRGQGIACQDQPHPMRWSEDFGRFGAVSRAALFLLGAGEGTPALHNPDYDFPDALIGTGVSAFLGIIGKCGALPARAVP